MVARPRPFYEFNCWAYHKNFKTWASPQGNKLREDIRTEPMNDSLKLLMNTIKNSDLQKRSQTADAYRSPAYFSTNVEMTARAFESYIQHELSKMVLKMISW